MRAPDHDALAPLAAAPGVALDARWVAKLAGGDEVVDDLERRGLAEREWDRVRATPAGVAAAKLDSSERDDWLRRVLLQVARDSTPRQADELMRRRGRAIAGLELVALARESAGAGAALELAQAIDGALALEGSWGAWRAAAEVAAGAARELGDREAEALALHQLGSRAVCFGDAALATKHLGDAARIRDELGDVEGAELSRHNLAQLRRPPGGSSRGRLGRALGLAAVALVAAVVAVALLPGGDESQPPPEGRSVSESGPSTTGAESEPPTTDDARDSPLAAVEPRRLVFGQVDFEAPDPAQAVSVRNVGAGVLRVGEATTSEKVFTVTQDGCRDRALRSGTTCTIRVVFRAEPPAATHSGELRVLDAGGGSLASVALLGTAVPPKGDEPKDGGQQEEGQQEEGQQGETDPGAPDEPIISP